MTRLRKGLRPRALGIYAHSRATAATVTLYGNCVRTWSSRLQELAVELRIVVSEMGEQWSPKMAPSSTAPRLTIVVRP